MIPGEDKFYACPICAHPTRNPSLISGNTFQSTLYSDGRTIAPMLPDFPMIKCCDNCDRFFWLDKRSEVDEISDVPYAEFLSPFEYENSLAFLAREEGGIEIFIRRRILWGLNNKRRKEPVIELSEDESSLFNRNAFRLLEILDENDQHELILKIELLRNLEFFEECYRLLENVDDEYNWIKTRVTQKLLNEDKYLFVLVSR